jgi:presenilin enhancer 2
MNLEKLSEQQLLDLTKKYFYLGLLFLPMIWCLNFAWIYPFVQKHTNYSNYTEIRKFLIFSAIGATIWATGITFWIVTFLTRRNDWSFADVISVFIPKGY